jgi:hypothetical protein
LGIPEPSEAVALAEAFVDMVHSRASGRLDPGCSQAEGTKSGNDRLGRNPVAPTRVGEGPVSTHCCRFPRDKGSTAVDPNVWTSGNRGLKALTIADSAAIRTMLPGGLHHRRV